jgi:hypothetical protein
VSKAELALAEAFFERGTASFANFAEMWGEVLEQLPIETIPAKCPYCERSLMQRRAVHPLFDRISRDCIECGRCGAIFDQDPEGPIENMELRAEELWHRDKVVRAELAITPRATLDRTIAAYAAIHTVASSRNQITFPQLQRISLDPGETKVIAVSAELSAATIAHQDFLRGFVVAEGTVNCASRPVWIRPALRRDADPAASMRG